ncbi:hypothetical protein BH09PSE5_BH09PSE5_32480 [soil metagenome]
MPAMTPEQIESYVDATSSLLGLNLSKAHRPGVLGFFALAKGYADIVNAVELEPHQDSAMRFEPISPKPTEGSGQ